MHSQPMIATMEGPKKCNFPGCDEVRSDYDKGRLCIRHARCIQMARSAKRAGKYAPTSAEMESLCQKAKNMTCKYCGARMVWRVGAKEKRRNVVTLQHCPSGAIELICLSCNVKEGNSQHGRHYNMPCGKYICSTCKEMKDVSEFVKDSSITKGHKSECRKCKKKRCQSRDYQKKSRKRRRLKKDEINARNREDRKLNPEKYKKYNAQRRAKRAAKKAARQQALQGDSHLSGTFIEKQLAGG